MITFLSDLAEKILQNDQIALQDTAVILPNRRASRALVKELATRIGKSFFAPEIIDINDFVELLSPKKKLDNIALLFRLFQSYQQIGKMQNSALFSFFSWGNTFLQDINDIDMQMVDASLVFQNLKEVKELETIFGKEELTDNQKNYLVFFQQLRVLYDHFNQELLKDNVAYEGAIYKDVALNIATYAPQLKYKRYIFAGLSALSPAEIRVVNYFIDHQPTELYFDLDHFFEESQQSIIQMLKENLHLQELHTVYNHYATVPKMITEVGVNKKVTQILYAIDRLNEIEKEQGNLNQTALVLADESLLLPFVHAYDCSKANLTMGYPFRETTVANLLKTLFLLGKNSLRFKEIEQISEWQFYYKDLMALFENPIIVKCFSSHNEHFKFIKNFINRGKTFYKFSEIPQIPDFLLPDLRCTGAYFLNQIYEYCLLLQPLFDNNSFDFKCFTLINQILSDTVAVLGQFSMDKAIDFQTLELLLSEQINKLSIPLRGDPDEGLQVMGVLETRAFDFKNIIILSVNEDILPAGKKQTSLILYDLKQHFQLPTFKQKDAVFAYHFFRLLARAEKVWLVYNTDSSKSLAEKSRFINQLEFEIKAQHLENIIDFRTEVVKIKPDVSGNNDAVIIHKNEKIVEQLRSFVYAPTSLSIYLKCQVQFYLKYIQKILPPKTIFENIEQKVTGSVLHEILEEIFLQIIKAPAQGQQIIEQSLKNIHKTVQSHFAQKEETAGMDQTKGKLFLTIEITKQNLTKYLQFMLKESKKATLEVFAVEKKFETSILVNNYSIKLSGIA
ncbi:MAG: PD-(D/E)XK nuclease family protein, partial [Bacteroidales bacterium]|nr:PD-(D/E)XK nuclease family protein [Bacteroidales bacterium]